MILEFYLHAEFISAFLWFNEIAKQVQYEQLIFCALYEYIVPMISFNKDIIFPAEAAKDSSSLFEFKTKKTVRTIINLLFNIFTFFY